MSSNLAVDVVATLAALFSGIAVFRANPARSVNQAFGLLSILAAVWAGLLGLLALPAYSDSRNPAELLRLVSAIAAFFPFFLWILKRCILGDSLTPGLILKGYPWLLLGLSLSIICYSQLYIPSYSSRSNPVHGWGYNLYTILQETAFALLLTETLIQSRRAAGIHKLELQATLLGFAGAGLCGIGALALGSWFDVALLRRGLPCVVIVSYAFTAWAITARKVFDARYLFRSILTNAAYFSVAAIIISLAINAGLRFAPPFLVVLTSSLTIVVALEFSRRRLLLGGDFQSDSPVAATRRSIISISRESNVWPTMEKQFNEALAKWGRTEHSYILVGSGEGYYCEEFDLVKGSSPLAELLASGWVTPESLLRLRATRQRMELLQFLRMHRLGALVITESGSADVSVAVAIQTRYDRKPFLWPEIQLLQEWSAVIANAHSRIALSQQARDSEQLAAAGLLGASLAHEIRNPLVSIKLIVQSAAVRYEEPAFKRLLVDLIPGEIERIESLVTGLMTLGRPRENKFETIALNEIVRSTLALTQSKAVEAGAEVLFSPVADSDDIIGDAAGLKQVIINLVMNAIEAVTSVPGERQVRIGTHRTAKQMFFEVSDNGPGIPQEIRSRLFRPFTTLNKTTGMGLGLAITSQIVRSHHGEIEVIDTSFPGTTFRVSLPCLQSLS